MNTRLQLNTKSSGRATIWINRSVRVLVSLFLIWIIYTQIESEKDLLEELRSIVAGSWKDKYFYLLLAILFMPLNYLLESMKWLTLVSHFEKHNLIKAIKGVLTGITAGLITPARMGDYVGKLMFIKAENNWKAVWANFTTGIAQTLITFLGALLGLVILSTEQLAFGPNTQIVLIIGSVLLSILGIWVYHNLHLIVRLKKHVPSWKFLEKLRNSMKVMVGFDRKRLNTVLLFASLRYLFFLTQFYFLLIFWGIDAHWMLPFSISVIYLLQTLVPFPPLMGLLAKGEIALLLLAYYGQNNLAILAAVFSIWVLNLLIPALCGLFILYRTNITKTLGYVD